MLTVSRTAHGTTFAFLVVAILSIQHNVTAASSQQCEQQHIMTDVQTKWNTIYSQSKTPDNSLLDSKPVLPVLQEFQHLLPTETTGKRALDVACGVGHNAVFLARRGLAVDAWDISDVAMTRLSDYAQRHQLDVTPSVMNIQAESFPKQVYDLILVSHFLDRDLAAAIVRALKPGGLLIYQTFCKEVTPEYSGPRNPDFRLDRNELLQLFSSLKVVYYREEHLTGDLSNGLRNEAILIGQKEE